MKKLIITLVAAATFLVPIGAAQAAPAASKVKVDCTVFLYKPAHFLGIGLWRPKTYPHGWTMADWYDACWGRFKPQKKSPNTPMGPWGTTVHLDVKNCTYSYEEAWLSDKTGWRKANIYISPWRAG